MGTEIVSMNVDQRILDYFEDHVMRFGLNSFTVDRMAKELKMSKRTVYRRFPNKPSIVNAAVERLKYRLDQHFLAMAKKEGRPAQLLMLTINGVLDTLTPFINQSIADLKQSYPEIWHSLEIYRFEKFNHLFQLMRQAQKDGDINPNLNLDRLATLLPLIMDHLFQPEVVFHPAHASRDMVNEVFMILFQGIFTGEMRDSLPQLLNKKST